MKITQVRVSAITLTYECPKCNTDMELTKFVNVVEDD